MAFYSLFALVPTLFLALAIVTAIFGSDATQGRLVDRLDGIVGHEFAEQTEEAVAVASENSNTSGFVMIALVPVVYSASILFVSWRDSLDAVGWLPYLSGAKTTLGRPAFPIATLSTVDRG